MKKLEQILTNAIANTEFAGKAYYVGGYVRDAVMQRPSCDVDVVVALPEGGLRLARYLHAIGVTNKPVIFEKFGTASVQIASHTVEFVMTRSESYRDKDRKPDVVPGTLLEDVMRRDFTINTLLRQIGTDAILDLTQRGLDDIKAGIIRSTSDPELIFREDPLRILRALRFAAQLGFTIEAGTAAGIHKNAATLAHISWERRRDELRKLLLSPDPLRGIQLLITYGLMPSLIPRWDIVKKPSWLPPDAVAAIDADLPARLGMFMLLGLEFDTVHYRNVLTQLRFSKEIIGNVISFCRQINILWPALRHRDVTDVLLRKVMYLEKDTHTPQQIMQCFEAVNHISLLPLMQRLSQISETFSDAKMPVSGQDIQSHFAIKTGVNVGKYLQRATDIWLENPQFSREEILHTLEQS